jgi:hypothetical protein
MQDESIIVENNPGVLTHNPEKKMMYIDDPVDHNVKTASLLRK